MNNICIFGASTTAGCWDKEKGGWVNRLRLDLEVPGAIENLQVFNLSISGQTTADLLKRVNNESSLRDVGTIIISVGTNDSCYIPSKDSYNILPDEFEANLIKLGKDSKKIAQSAVFVGLTAVDESQTTPLPWNKDKFIYNKEIIKYIKITKEVCDENGWLFIDVFNEVDPKTTFDGLHPNAEGHEKIFQKVKQELIKNKIITI